MPRKRRTKAQKQFDDILGAVAAYNPRAPKGKPADKKPVKKSTGKAK